MSTKATISFGPMHHLYEETLNNSYVFLEMEEVELNVNILKNGRSGIRITIPISEWRQIIEDWKNHPWADELDRDNGKITITKEMFDKFVTNFRNRYPGIFTEESCEDDLLE